MSKKSLANKGLSLLFHSIIMDGAWEQTMKCSKKKCSEVGTQAQQQTEPYTPWSNAAEAAIIRELKKESGD